MLRVLAVSLLLAPIAAQPFAAGSRALTFANPTGSGSASLPATVWYPAQSAGTDTAILPRAGGWPVVVFLHGFATLGSSYAPIGEQLATRGYVAVLGDTAQFSAATQVLDGRAWFAALQTANATAGGFLTGALDMARAGLCGHSMGGGSTIEVLAQNPGYRAGVCLAPVISARAGAVRTPLLVIHGSGDLIVPWAQGQANWQNATGATGVRTFSLLDASATHTNVAGFLLLSATDRAVFAHSTAILAGFFDAWLRGDAAGLEAVFGAGARTQPRLLRVDVAVETPALWATGRTAPGQQIALTTGAEPGPAALFAAAGTASIDTALGRLLLDPATIVLVGSGSASSERLWTTVLAVPDDPALIGVRVPFQAIGNGGTALRLSGLWVVAIGA